MVASGAVVDQLCVLLDDDHASEGRLAVHVYQTAVPKQHFQVYRVALAAELSVLAVPFACRAAGLVAAGGAAGSGKAGGTRRCRGSRCPVGSRFRAGRGRILVAPV